MKIKSKLCFIFEELNLLSFVAVPEYNSWDCEKCSSTPGFTSCMYNGCWKSPTGCCHPNVDDGFKKPCKSYTGQAIEDPCLRKTKWLKYSHIFRVILRTIGKFISINIVRWIHFQNDALLWAKIVKLVNFVVLMDIVKVLVYMYWVRRYSIAI